MTKTLCLYRAGDADALLAAWAVHHALGDDMKFIAVKPNDLPPYAQPTARMSVSDHAYDYPELRGQDVLILGLTYPLRVLRVMAAAARSVLILTQECDETQNIPSTWLTSYSEFIAAAGTNELRANTARKDALSVSGIAWDYFMGGGLHRVTGLEKETSSALDPPAKLRPWIIDLMEDFVLGCPRFGEEARAFHAVLTSCDSNDLSTMFTRIDKWATTWILTGL